MKKIFVALSMVALLAACDDSSSALAENKDSTTLSSAEGQVSSSSTKKLTDSSDSNCEECNDDAISSSGNAESNWSSDSSGAGKVNSSLSEAKKTSWDYLNPDIDYSEFVDKRDGQVYKAVKIGEQVWMAQNLNYETENSWCGAGMHDSAVYVREGDCAIYGRLYTWAAAIDSVKLYDYGYGMDCGTGKTCTLPAKVQGICPEGWHLPTDVEWSILVEEEGGRWNAGKVLKAQTGWPVVSGTTYKDAVGFSALPAGKVYDGLVYQGGFNAYFWSASEDNKINNTDYFAYSIELSYGIIGVSEEGAILQSGHKTYGFSVRCVRD